MSELKQPKPGDVIVYHDPRGNASNGLVTAGWSPTCVNLVLVVDDEAMQDDCGRQIKRYTSCSHKSTTPVHGNYWRWPEEEPNPYVPPVTA